MALTIADPQWLLVMIAATGSASTSTDPFCPPPMSPTAPSSPPGETGAAVISGHRLERGGALTLYAAGDEVARLEPGDRFAWAPYEQRWCVGACPPGEEPQPCPDGAPAAKGCGSRCETCLDASKLACVRCTGAFCINPARLEACRVPHFVYLAAYAIDDRAVKVGVARADRLGERLREQGCFGGVAVLWAADGQQARAVETRIRKAGWKDRIHLAALAHLAAPEPLEVVELLDIHRARLAARMPELPWLRTTPVIGFEADDFPRLPEHTGKLTLLDPSKECVGGTYLGARGQSLIVELPCRRYGLLPLRSLYGRRVIATDPANAGRPQLSLF